MRLIALAAALIVGALLVPATAVSSATPSRPHKAVCQGVPDDPLALQVYVTGTCQATHLGRDRFESSHTVIPIGFDPGTMTAELLIVGGEGKHRAANGDWLSSTYAGTGTAYLLTGRIEFEFTGTFTGGTGRFAGASGSSIVRGAVEAGVAHFTENGSISY